MLGEQECGESSGWGEGYREWQAATPMPQAACQDTLAYTATAWAETEAALSGEAAAGPG